MALTKIPIYTQVIQADTANTVGTLVVRDTDGSILVGQVKVASLANSGGTSSGVLALTANATLDNTSTLITGDATSGAFTVTVPAASSSKGYEYYVTRLNTGSNAVFIKSTGSDSLISSGTIATTTSLAAIGHQVHIYCDGVQWLLR